jgi:hypothetical protein
MTITQIKIKKYNVFSQDDIIKEMQRYVDDVTPIMMELTNLNTNNLGDLTIKEIADDIFSHMLFDYRTLVKTDGLRLRCYTKENDVITEFDITNHKLTNSEIINIFKKTPDFTYCDGYSVGQYHIQNLTIALISIEKNQYYDLNVNISINDTTISKTFARFFKA